MMMPTAMSTMLPFMANSLNSFSMTICSGMVDGGMSEPFVQGNRDEDQVRGRIGDVQGLPRAGRALPGRLVLAAAALLLSACGKESPVEVEVETDPNRVAVEGLWAGQSQSGEEERLVCLKMVEPDSAAAFELVEVDTEVGSGIIAAAEGQWSYRPPRIEIELFHWGDPRGIPRLSAEIAKTGRTMLLRVVYRQGDQFTVALTRAIRCGRFVA
jgi:hypothetical protein